MEVEYTFYTTTYRGSKIPENEWKRISHKAEQRLNSYTFDRCSDDWTCESWCNRAKCAVCDMSEILYTDEKRNGKTSENTDGYSVSYDTGKSLERSLYDVVRVYLGDTGLLYSGVNLC